MQNNIGRLVTECIFLLGSQSQCKSKKNRRTRQHSVQINACVGYFVFSNIRTKVENFVTRELRNLSVPVTARQYNTRRLGGVTLSGRFIGSLKSKRLAIGSRFQRIHQKQTKMKYRTRKRNHLDSCFPQIEANFMCRTRRDTPRQISGVANKGESL